MKTATLNLITTLFCALTVLGGCDVDDHDDMNPDTGTPIDDLASPDTDTGTSGDDTLDLDGEFVCDLELQDCPSRRKCVLVDEVPRCVMAPAVDKLGHGD